MSTASSSSGPSSSIYRTKSLKRDTNYVYMRHQVIGGPLSEFKYSCHRAKGGAEEGPLEGAGEEKGNVDGEQFKRPIIVHRAMLGSVERMIGVLTEHFGGKW
jgi:threonyl-tRNA synthetase